MAVPHKRPRASLAGLRLIRPEFLGLKRPSAFGLKRGAGQVITLPPRAYKPPAAIFMDRRPAAAPTGLARPKGGESWWSFVKGSIERAIGGPRT